MKRRLDVYLFENGLVSSIEKAKALIMSGEVYVENIRETKPGTSVEDNASVTLKENKAPYVSRGYVKLEKAIGEFNISLEDKVAADIGASTGGFSECMLQHGAAYIYAVDVGYGQLAWSLRNDSRLKVVERTNARYLTKEIIPKPLDFVAIDVSFISIKTILPGLLPLMKDEGEIVCLIKPQFEAARQG